MQSVEIENPALIKGIPFPPGERFREIIVTGPPGSGKTYLMSLLGGWPEEGYLDLALEKWWRSRILTFRPREVHLGIPFQGHEASLAVFEEAWLKSPTPIDYDRIQIPPEGGGILRTNWRGKYVFDFQLPDPEIIYAKRQERISKSNHPVDQHLSLEQVKLQVKVYADLAAYLHRKGLRVFIRKSFQGTPRYFVEPPDAA